MAFVPVADTVMVELFQRMHGQRVENTLYYKMVGGFGLVEVTELWNGLLIWWTTELAPQLSFDLTLVGAKITDLSSATSFAADFSAPTPNPAGAIGVGALPGNVALCVSMRTLGRGRSSRGRNYVAGLPESKVDGNTVQAPTVAAIEDAYNSLHDGTVAAPWVQVVVSRFTAGAPRPAGVAAEVTNARVVDPYVDSMRRRLTGRGL